MSGGNGFDEWGGYMEAKVTKLEEQYSAACNPFRQSELFTGISIFVNGLTDPSADELKRIMMVHGGTYHHYERPHTTYIIASNLPDVKVRNMNKSKIISPKWVSDCLREKKILDYTRYLLYTNQNTSQPRLQFRSKKEEELDIKNTTQLPSTNGNKALDQNGNIRKNIDTEPLNDLQSKKEPDTDNEIINDQKVLNRLSIAGASDSSGSCGIARSAVDPKFLNEYYNNSRLHNISTLGQKLKNYVNDLREKYDGKGFPARLSIKEHINAAKYHENTSVETLGSCIMHIDMDCFFVSVGLRKHSELRGLPVAVTHSKGGSSATSVPVHPEADRHKEGEMFAQRFEKHHNNILADKARRGFDSKMSLSEIASCSYEARAKGVRNGMFMGHALTMCPELKTIPYDYEGYEEVAFTLYNTIAQYTLDIEAVSCDEMFVDLKDVLTELKVSPMDFVRAIREEMRQKTSCPCSAGVGSNKLLARMATKRAKPDGQYQLESDDLLAYMSDIPIAELPGVGSSTTFTLSNAGLITCSDLQKLSLSKLQTLIGKKFGETLYSFCRGIDNRALSFDHIRKSISTEINYGIRFSDYAELEKFLRQICEEVHKRLTEIKRKTKCVTLKVMKRAEGAPVETSKFMGHGCCDNITRSVSLTEYSNDLTKITNTALTIMKSLEIPPSELRGIGLQLSKLDDPSVQNNKNNDNAIKSMFKKVLDKKQKEKKIQDGEMTSGKSDATSSQLKKVVESDKVLTKSSHLEESQKLKEDSMNRTMKRTRSNIIELLQNAPKVSKTIKKDMVTLPTEIDPEVFFQLPLEIQQEILNNEQERQLNISIKKKVVYMDNADDPDEVDMLPSTSKKAKERQERKFKENPEQNEKLETHDHKDNEIDFQKRSNTLETNIFLRKDCTNMLMEWTNNSEKCPERYDVNLISKFAIELVQFRKISPLYDALKFLFRIINNKKSCDWHMAYKYIVKKVQVEMVHFYDGCRLEFLDEIRCKKCVDDCLQF